MPVSHLRRATPSSNDETTPATLSAYYICVRITNRIYTESLNNQSSKEYKQLRKQVEQMVRVCFLLLRSVHRALTHHSVYTHKITLCPGDTSCFPRKWKCSMAFPLFWPKVQFMSLLHLYQATIVSVPMSLPVKLPELEVPGLFYSLYFYVCC